MIPRFLRRSVALGLVAAALGSGCSSTMRDAATIRYEDADGNELVVHIRRDDFEAELETILANDDAREQLEAAQLEVGGEGTAPTQLAAQWLADAINALAIDAEFEARDLTVTDDQRAAADQQIPALFTGELRDLLIEREARLQALIGAVTSEVDAEIPDPTDADVRDYYEANREALEACPSGRNIETAVFELETDAQAALDQINDGASFSDIGNTAGFYEDVLCIENSQFGETFAEAARTATLDEVFGPVQSDVGFHVVRITPWAPTFDALADQVRAALQQQVEQERSTLFQERGQQVLERWYEQSSIHIDARYGSWDEEQRTVVPPSSPNPRTEREPAPEPIEAPFPPEGG